MLIDDGWDLYKNNFRISDQDIYFQEKYYDLYYDETFKKKCFIYKESNKIFLMPFLLQRIKDTTYFDFESAYGYGGPITNTSDQLFLDKAIKNMEVQFAEESIIAGFVRFHPLLKNEKLFENRYNVIFDRKTVALNLELEEDKIWMEEIHSKHRNVIRKAESNGLEFVLDENFDYLEDFIRLYESTMTKLKAEKFYFFNKSYFYKLKSNLKEKVFLAVVIYQNKVISAAIFFKFGIYGHYHLAGSDEEYLNLYPNNFLIYNVILYLKRNSVKWLHLGGGSDNSENNTLYKFKKRFSSTTLDFKIGKLIFNADIYNALCKDWELKNPQKKEKYKNYFLKYRS